MEQTLKKPRREHRQLQQIIAGLTEGVILVDPDQTILWANDAALAMHGAKRLKDLGATVDEYRKRFQLRYRNNHPLERGQYPIERVISGEKFSDVIVEVTHVDDPEQCWVHSIRSLVITNDTDEPDFLVLIISDESERFEAEERFESTFNANPAPAIICRLSDLRYVKVNQGFCEITGYSREDVIGRSIYEIDVLAKADKRDLALERLKEQRTIPQMEACLPLPTGGERFVIVAGQPIEIADESCMLFTFADLEPRKNVETALRQSEERFAKSFQLSPVPAVIFRLEGLKIMEVNEGFTSLVGYTAEEVVGHDATELRLWAERSAQLEFERAIAKTGSVRNVDLKMRARDGSTLDCLVSAETVTLSDQDCVLGVLQDISERKRSEDELITAIETVMADTSWFSRTIVEKLAALRQISRPASAGGDLDDLTDREREVLGLICQGRSDPEMSEALRVSRNTVRNHVSALYRKIGVHRRGAAIIWARERGITGKDAIKPRKRTVRPKS